MFGWKKRSGEKKRGQGLRPGGSIFAEILNAKVAEAGQKKLVSVFFQFILLYMEILNSPSGTARAQPENK